MFCWSADDAEKGLWLLLEARGDGSAAKLGGLLVLFGIAIDYDVCPLVCKMI